MARGTPDGGIAPYQFASQQVDTAALANILWGFSPIDGQGRTVYLDTFNNGLQGWFLQTIGAVGPATLTSAFGDGIFMPPTSVKLDSSGNPGDQCGIFRQFALGKAARLGIEEAVVVGPTTPNYRASIDYFPVGGVAKLAVMQYDPSTFSWQVLAHIGAGDFYQTFYTPGMPPAAQSMFQQIKLVADWSTGKYVRAYVGEQVFDVSQYSLASSSLTWQTEMIANVRVVSIGGALSAGVVGYVLLTKDEP